VLRVLCGLVSREGCWEGVGDEVGSHTLMFQTPCPPPPHPPYPHPHPHQTVKFRIEAGWMAADAQRGTSPTVALERAGPHLEPACGCEDGLPVHHIHSSSYHRRRSGGDDLGQPTGPRPLGEGAEGGAGEGGGCCSGSRSAGLDAAGLTVPLAQAPLHKTSFERTVHVNGGAANGHHLQQQHYGRKGGVEPASWLDRQMRPGGLLDGALLGRDLVRALMTFVTTALSYVLMLAAMSFHVAIFFAVCTGIAVGTGLFGRYRSYVAVAHQDRCCG